MPESATDTAPAADTTTADDTSPDTGTDAAAAAEDTNPEPAKPDTEPASKGDDSNVGDIAKQLAAATAEAAKWKAAARKHEDRAKANAGAATELEQLRLQAMSDQERAVAEAKAAGRTEALREFGTKLVDAEFRAAAAKHSIDDETLSTIFEMVDLGRYVDDDGEVKKDDIAGHLAKFAPKPQPAPEPKNDEPAAAQPGVPDLGQGVRNAGGKPTPGLNEDVLTRDLERALGIR